MVDTTFDDGQFIELIQQYSIIWNRKDPNHKNKIKVENAWTTIAEIMNETVECCEQQWTNIRHRFAKERRLAQRPSGAGAYTITWPFYNACSFLEEVVVTRKTVGNIKKNPTATVTVESKPQEQSKILWEVMHDETEPGCSSQTEMEDIIIEVDQPDVESPAPLSEADETRSGSSSRLRMLRSAPKKRTRQEEEGAAIAELSSTISSAFKEIKGMTENMDDPEKNDEDFVFGRTVAVMLMNIKGTKRKALLKAKIITLIAEATEDD